MDTDNKSLQSEQRVQITRGFTKATIVIGEDLSDAEIKPIETIGASLITLLFPDYGNAGPYTIYLYATNTPITPGVSPNDAGSTVYDDQYVAIAITSTGQSVNSFDRITLSPHLLGYRYLYLHLNGGVFDGDPNTCEVGLKT